MNVPPRFGFNLRTARIDADVGQEEPSERCGVHGTEVSRLERGRGAPRPGTPIGLASVLGSSVERLCGGMSWDERTQSFAVESRSASA